MPSRRNEEPALPRQIPSQSADPKINSSPDLEQTRIRCTEIRNRLIRDGLYHSPAGPEPAASRDDRSRNIWRVSPAPFEITAGDLKAIESLGPQLLGFYTALNRLYFASVRGSQPRWISEYLDQGKPEVLIEYGRMNRFKQHLPGVLRPDLILTEEGWIVTELDSVPGGIGLTGSLSRHYSALGHAVIGGPDGMVDAFSRMIRSVSGSADPSLAIVVSEESADYRPEMRWLGDRLSNLGLKTSVVRPEEVEFTEAGLLIPVGDSSGAVDVIYRFFELFDLKNIPKSELILYSVKKDKARMTPPAKPSLEEKMAFALFHHPALRAYWLESLGDATEGALRKIFPKTWIVDPREVPPHAVIPDLRAGHHSVRQWRELSSLTQKERRYVLKPSGFSEKAWGSRGVVVGHDLSEKDWAQALEDAQLHYPQNPSVLQEFQVGKQYAVWYDDPAEPHPNRISGRVRLSPYYFVSEGRTELGGILATICPLDKKLIHGMTEAVMAPCAVKN
jgi:hypothetical protein